MVSAALSQGVGYGIVLGLGFAFAFGMFSRLYLLTRLGSTSANNQA